MTREEEQIRRKELHQLLDLVLDINSIESRQQLLTKDKPTAFFYFFGNVCSADISVHEKGWSDGARADYKESSIYFDEGLYGKKRVSTVINHLEELRDRLAAGSYE